ncbi:hypothetical protein Tco_1334729 [Tanacetum coccineum]
MCEARKEITNNGSVTQLDMDSQRWSVSNVTSRELCKGMQRGLGINDTGSMNQDNSRRTINVEEISSKAMLAINGAGFDWSFMADKEVPSDMALMLFQDSDRYIMIHLFKNLVLQA